MDTKKEIKQESRKHQLVTFAWNKEYKCISQPITDCTQAFVMDVWICNKCVMSFDVLWELSYVVIGWEIITCETKDETVQFVN